MIPIETPLVTRTDLAIEAFHQVASIEFLLLLVFVSIVGIIAGALPGVGPALAMVLFFPLTFTVAPEVGLMVMAVIFITATYGASIPAILINVPGSSGSAATLLDGYPMTQNGRATEALGVSVISSFIGALIGLVGLLAFAPTLAQVSMYLGPAQFFWLAVLGLCTVAAASRGSVLKSLIAACLGVLLASIGTDPMTATPRFTFGSTYLEAGIDLIVLLVGLFAVSEVFHLLKTKYGGGGSPPMEGNMRDGVESGLQNGRQQVQGGLIGLFIGAVPGLGTGPANFLSYLTSMSLSSKPERYGSGAPEGVIAAESSNNASAVSALIPTITLAIPGSPSAAVFLGVMLTYGVSPGPNVFESSLPYVIFVSIFIGALVFLFVGLFGARFFSKVTQFPQDVMIISVTVLALAGCFAMRNNILDVGAAVLIGILGYLMRQRNYSLIAFIIAFILAPIAEQGFFRALRISGGEYSIFVTGHINTVLIIGSIGILIMPILLNRRSGEAE
ncbi:tripartite tricarboxylate transporter permease [Natrialbaceae archaeon A-arb3/5]